VSDGGKEAGLVERLPEKLRFRLNGPRARDEIVVRA
jgi:hypothetical protein